MRVELPRRPLGPVTFFAGLALFAVLAHRAEASDVTPLSRPPHTTLVVFSEQRLSDDQWQALFAALRKNLPSAIARAGSIDPNPDLFRGDAIVSGFSVQSAISVYLHGDCVLVPEPKRYITGQALGWVYEVRGEIEPFMHVDCNRIRDILGPSALGMNSTQRIAAMSEAMARVMLHEWIHIATQDRAHSERGISKSAFGVEDLIPVSGRSEIPPHLARKTRDRKSPCVDTGQ